MSVRRSSRKNKGQSPSRLGASDGWADAAASQWAGVDHKEVSYDENDNYSDEDENGSEAEKPKTATTGATQVHSIERVPVPLP